MKRQNEILVGLLTTVAVAILMLGMYWLARGGFARGYDLYTVVNWGQGLKTGQRVLFSGVSIGHVEDVELHQDGKLVIKMIVDDKYKIPLGSTASIQAFGLFGDMMVAVAAPAPGDRFYEKGDTLPSGKPSPTPQDIITSADSLTRAAQAIMSGIQRELIDAGAIGELRNALVSTNKLVNQVSSIAAAQSIELSGTMQSLRRSIAAVDSTMIDSTLRNFQRASNGVNTFIAGLDSTSLRLSSLMTKLESGEGTAAKLLNDPALYNDLRGTVSNLNSLLDDFKANPRKYLDFSFSIFGGRRRE